MHTERCDLFTRLIRTRPLLLAALLFLMGCIIGYSLHISGWICCALIAFMLLFALLISRGHRRSFAIVLILLAFLPMGALRFEWAWNAAAPLPDQKKAELCGRIVQNPIWNPETERSICILDELSINGEAVDGRLRLYLRGDTQLLTEVQLGQNIRCTAHIWQAEGSDNPGEFNFSNYLRVNGLRGYATAEIDSAVLTAPVHRLSDLPERIRAAFSTRVNALFPKNPALAQAFLLGDRSGLSDEDRESYSISGAAHLLAISGMHVSVLAGMISLLLSQFCNRNRAFGITLLCLLAYGVIIGFSASILRAIMMYAVFSAAPLLGRYSDAPTRLGAAMLIYLMIRPLAILESSFVLSYGACAGILLLYAPIQRLFHAERLLHRHAGGSLWARIRNDLPRRIVQSLLVTLAAQLAILPAVVHYFGSQPVWSFAVNLIAVPLGMAAYLFSLIALLSGAAPIALLADGLFSLLTACVRFFSALPFHSIGIARFPLWLTLVCALACFCASDLCALPEKLRRFLPLTVLAAVLVSNFCAYTATGGCSITFLDAGEADCSVICADHKVYLVDTGDTYTPAADYLSAMNASVEAIFLTHPHSDHAGGLDSILDVVTPRRIYLSANWDSYEIDEGIPAALERAQAQGAEIISLSAGDTFALSEQTFLEVLSPAAGFPAQAANDDSLVLQIHYGECSALLTGDASSAVTEGCAVDADILKIAHHGSRDALSADLLAQVSPSMAVIPVGYNNYGHPSEESLALLQATQAQLFRTDLHGAVRCRLHTDGRVDVTPYHTSEAGNGLE